LRDDFCLPVSPKRFSRNHIAIMRTPVTDTDFGKITNDIFESNRVARRGIKQGLALIRCSPLWTADKVLAPRFGAVTAAAHFCQAFDQGSLLIRRYRLHAE